MVDYESYVRPEPERLTVTATAEAIARFCWAAGDTHPEHFAPAGATAPPTFAFALAMAGSAFPFPTEGLIHAEQAFTFDKPLRAGQRLTVERALTRARRRGDGDAAMWLLTWEAEALGADGGRVFSLTSRLIARQGVAAAAPAPAARQGGPDPAGLPLRGPAAVLDRARIAAYAEASGDHNPIHLDEETARRYGLSGIIAHGMLSMALVASLAEDWARSDDRPLAALTARFVAPVLAGERVLAAGEPQGDLEATLGLWSEGGEEKVRATARRDPAAAA